MGIFPHTKTPEEQIFFDRLAAMKIELMPGMHVLSEIYPHRDECGGQHDDDIIVSSKYGQPTRYEGELHDGVGTISEDFRGKTSSAASYYVPKLTHFETFLMCLRIAQDREAKSVKVEGYVSVFHRASNPQWPEGELLLAYPGVVSDAWQRPEWRDAVIEGLTQALIDSAPRKSQ